MRKLFFIPLLLIAAGGAGRADVFYDDLGSWEAAANSVTSVDFESSVPPGSDSIIGAGAGTNITVGGINFAVGPSSDGSLFLVGDNILYPGAVIASAYSSTPVNDLLITLPSPVTALGFTFGDFYGDTATITLSDGAVAYPTANAYVVYPSLGFFGVTGSTGITSVDITTPDPIMNVGSVYTGMAAAPEPAYFAEGGLLLAFITGLALRRRLKEAKN
jgi:hypothetical protein